MPFVTELNRNFLQIVLYPFSFGWTISGDLTNFCKNLSEPLACK